MEQIITTEISLKFNSIKYCGKVTTIEKHNEFQYLLNLQGMQSFTIHLSDDGYWESDNLTIDPLLIMHAGEAIENMEDFTDVLMELDSIRFPDIYPQ